MDDAEDRSAVVKVKVKKYSGDGSAPVGKSFAMDPSLSSYETLRALLAKAFALPHSGFVISYVVRGRRGGEEDKLLPMLSEWDFRTAVYGAAQPQLLLKLDLKPFEAAGLEEWDIIEVDQVPPVPPPAAPPSSRLSWLPSLSAHAAKLIAASTSGGAKSKGGRGMTDAEFRALLSSDGTLLSQERLRQAVFQSGVEPSLRPVLWRHLLNLYPPGMNGKDRIAYTKSLAAKYVELKECWQRQLRSGRSSENLRLVANAVRKDVVRTDRSHPFFAGPEEENRNLLALFNLLTTYALAHPSIAYCQGMSDLASPILVVMGDEAEAYVCFCALMRRLRGNFACDGRVITEKFAHLAELLQYYDPVFWQYLLENHAEDLLFCYRWLLLELKREFAFDDALLVLEVTWASLPPDPPGPEGISLCQMDLTKHSAPLDIGPRASPTPLSSFASTLEEAAASPFSSPSFMDEEVSRSLLVESGGTSEDDPFASSASVPRGMHGPHGSCPGGTVNACAHLHRSLLRKGGLRTTSHRPSEPTPPDAQTQPPPDEDGMESPEKPKLSRAASWPQLHSLNRSSLPPPLPSDSPPLRSKPSLPSKAKRFCSGGHGSQDGAGMILSDFPMAMAEDPSRPRLIRGGTETQAVDGSPTGLERKEEEAKLPIPLAVEASHAVPVSVAAGGELTLNDIFDICVTQATVREPAVEATLRSRQTSGEPTSSDNSQDSSRPAPPNSLPLPQRPSDSGYSGGSGQRAFAHFAELALTTTPSQSSVPEQASPLVGGGGGGGEEELFLNVERDRAFNLPPPDRFGDGNPFMMFVCLTLLLEHRDRLMKRRADFNDIAIYFDKLARQHSAPKILRRARLLYADYLSDQEDFHAAN